MIGSRVWPVYLLAALLAAGLYCKPAFTQELTERDLLSADDSPDSLSETDLPFGTATSYMLGTTLLEQGDLRSALPYLHQAYQLGADEPDIATAYLSALLGLGYQVDALAVLENMIQNDPENYTLRRQHVALLSDVRRYEDALSEITELQKAGDDSLELMLMEARLLAGTGRTKEAIDVFRAALEAESGIENQEQIYLLLARLLEETGQEAELSALWIEAVSDLPESNPIYFGLLRHLVSKGQKDEALRLARQKDEREYSGVYADDQAMEKKSLWQLELVELFVQQEDFKSAIALLSELREADQLDLEASLWLSRLLLREDRVGDAIRHMRQVVKRWPDSDRAHYYLGDLLTGSGEITAGEAELREALRLDPRQPEYHISLLRLLMVRHESVLRQQKSDSVTTSVLEEIGQTARKAAALIHPQDHRSQLILGFAFRATNDLYRAQEQFQEASTNPEFRKEALLQLAICQMEAEDEVEAMATLETLWQEYPGDPVVANSLGYFLAERGTDLERAERLIRFALQEEPENGAFIDSLGWVLFQQGRYEAAFDQLVQAANAIPDDATILEHLGMTLRALGQDVEAIRVLQRAMNMGGESDRLSPIIRELEDAQ